MQRDMLHAHFVLFLQWLCWGTHNRDGLALQHEEQMMKNEQMELHACIKCSSRAIGQMRCAYSNPARLLLQTPGPHPHAVTEQGRSNEVMSTGVMLRLQSEK